MNVHNYASTADRIEQLEAALDLARKERVINLNRLSELEQDKAFLITDLKRADTDCRFCAHSVTPAPCDAADCDCSICKENCICKTCRDNSNWQWKGRVEDGK